MDKNKILSLYKDIRVADVRDALDALGYHFQCSMNQNIRPLFRTRIYGIAHTVRYLPFRGKIPSLTPLEYRKRWTGEYYKDICPYPWVENIEKGDVIVIDQSCVDAGLMGSENTLSCFKKGAVGFVSNGGVRDTDEIILQKIPFWCQSISQKMVQGRLQFDAENVPIACGGVTVYPKDLIVADGDGVIVVPVEIAEEVAKWAKEEHEQDKINRRKHYEDLGWEKDHTV